MPSRVPQKYRVLVISAPPLDQRGKIIELPGGVASVWLARGMIERVEPEPVVVETATAEPVVERAVKPAPVKRKRGRPRKVKPT